MAVINNTNADIKNPRTQVAAQGVGMATDYLSGYLGNMFGDDSELGRGMGTLFSSGVSAVGNTLSNNILKGTTLTEGLGVNAATSLAGSGSGLAANYIGRGINSLGGNSMLSRGIGQGVATGLGTFGGAALSNVIQGNRAFKGFTAAKDAAEAYKAAIAAGKTALEASDISKAASMASKASLWGAGMSIAGSAIGAAVGPSKEYGGKRGNITRTMDTAYDAIMAGANFIPGYGQILSGAMALNKGLSNLFGSTSGMTTQDAILGSAFMPVPVKWLNMAGAKTTSTFGNLSWQNTEKTNSFMGNAFGNLLDKFDLAREEAGKTYGTFSRGAYNKALDNLNFANYAWNKVLAMADLNELQNIRSLYMTSINNLRYAQMIQGGWNPIARGKQGMKIFNNATNHKVGMRLLSGAALIDNKQMILSALNGIKFKTTGGAGYVPPANSNPKAGTLKDIAYRIMSQDSYQGRTLSDIGTAVLESVASQPYYQAYSGSFLKNDAPDSTRDLNHLIVYGNTKKQFKPKKLNGFDYKNFLQKNYGVSTVPTYEGHIVLAKQMTIPEEYKSLVEYMADRPNLHYYTSDEDGKHDIIEDKVSPFKSVDDVASYRRSFRKNNKGEAELAAQDLIDYGANYGGKYGFIAGLQGALLNKVINSPVILDQSVPIKYSNNPKDFSQGVGWYNTLQEMVNNNHILQKYKNGDYSYPLVLPELTVLKKKSK